MPDNLHNNNLFDNLHFNKTEMKAKGISKLYAQMLQAIMSKFKIVEANPNKFFSFDDYNQYKDSMAKLFEAFSKNITTEINKQSKESWKYAELKNQKLLEQTMKKFGMKQLDLRKYKKSNLEALAAFQNRKDAGMNLSDKVWKYTNQFKKEIEMGIDVGLREGKSAVQIARDVKQYLQYPDKIFKKVKDIHGNLGLSKAAKAFHPGQGVYRSSMKNAMRLARTENNMAYHAANYDKYQDFDFVIGIEVKLSNNSHHCPFCEAMAGKYPKEFKFVGWHPHCRCTTIPILKTDKEMELDNDLIAAGQNPVPSQSEILDLPDNYKTYIEANKDKLNSMSSKPYWYQDNNGFQAKESPTIIPEVKVKKVKTAAEIAAIQSKWDARKAEHQKIKEDANLAVQDAQKWGVNPDLIQGFTNVQDQLSLKQIQANVEILKKQIEVQKLMFEQMKNEIPNLDDHFKSFNLLDIQKAKDAALSKIEMFKNDSAYTKDWFAKKLKFEIQWLEDKQKYSTWKVSQDIIKKELVDFQIKNLYDESYKIVGELQKEIKKNPTKKAQTFIDNILKGHKEKDVDLLELNMRDAADYLEARKNKSIIKKANVLSSDAYSAERKANAIRTGSAQEIDDLLRADLGDRWKKMDEQARLAAYGYTESSGKINRPLRGYDGSWYNFKGVGKVPLNNEKSSLITTLKKLDLEKGIEALAKEMEEHHQFKKDMWLRRGDSAEGFNKLFKVDISELRSQNKLTDLIGKTGVEEAFLSTSPCASSTMGFSGQIEYQIYAPKGTQGMYAEPFSHYGHGGKLKWDGLAKQSDFGGEFEMIINQGYEYQITNIRYDGYKYHVELQILKRDKRFKRF